MAIADDRQRFMPSPEDLMPDRSQQLAYPEAHLLTNPIDPAFLGEVRLLRNPYYSSTKEVFCYNSSPRQSCNCGPAGGR